MFGKLAITGNESYATFNPQILPGCHFFQSSYPPEVQNEEKVRKKDEFPEKYGIIPYKSRAGQISDPVILEGNFRRPIYLTRCIKAGLEALKLWAT